MATLKITRKHHKHLNNPFPSAPRSLPFIQGSLFFNSQTLPSHQIFPVGRDFQLLWSSKNGGHLSISHQSRPTRALWSTVPGQAFVSAALTETEIDESRGSFAIKDGNVLVVCDHQTIEDIRVIKQLDGNHFEEASDLDSSSGYLSFDQTKDLKDTQSPAEIIEHFTETIGRPPELPKWIISGAVVGMQGGTEVVRRIWDELKAYKVPISAFWLQEASQKGLPICRHLFLHYPNDKHVHSLSYHQFLVGTEILVVPVLDKGKQNVKAYFPEGETYSWKHVWSGKLFTEEGSEAWVEAPLGYPAVFIKDGTFVGETFLEN